MRRAAPPTVKKSPDAQVDRRLGAGGRGAPGRLEELAVRLGEVERAGRDALRREDGDRGIRRQVFGDAAPALEQRRRERLHPLDRDALGDLGEHAREGRELILHLAGALPDRVGEQQLAARRQVGLGQLARQRALVGDRERAQLLELVAEELGAHRMLGIRREDVEDAAAHRELAAAGDHVDPRVGEFDEGERERGELVAAAADGRGRSARARRGPARAAGGRRARSRRRSVGAFAIPGRHGRAGCAVGCRRSRRSGSVARAAGSPRRGRAARRVRQVSAEGIRHGVGLTAGRRDREQRLRRHPRASSRLASSGTRKPSTSEKSASRRASRTACSTVWACAIPEITRSRPIPSSVRYPCCAATSLGAWKRCCAARRPSVMSCSVASAASESRFGSTSRSAERERRQHVVGRVLAAGRAADADPHPGEVAGADRGGDVADAVVAAVAAAGLEADGVERQVELVVQHDRAATARASRTAAARRPGRRTGSCNVFGLASTSFAPPGRDPRLGDRGVRLVALEPRAEPVGQLGERHLADVVTMAGVAGPGIPEPGYEPGFDRVME